jgi:hypothetical protein
MEILAAKNPTWIAVKESLEKQGAIGPAIPVRYIYIIPHNTFYRYFYYYIFFFLSVCSNFVSPYTLRQINIGLAVAIAFFVVSQNSLSYFFQNLKQKCISVRNILAKSLLIVYYAI